MMPFQSTFSRLSHKFKHVIVTNVSLASWCNQNRTESSRFVQKVEICTALCAGDDAWGIPLETDHHHTLVKVSLAPTNSGPSGPEDTLVIERVLSTNGAYHSTTPIPEPLSIGGTLFHPDVHDRISTIADGPSTALVHHLVVERTLTFENHDLSLAQFAEILGFISTMTGRICDGGDCKFQSRSFAFTCLAALAPRLPPRKAGQGMAPKVSWGGSEPLDDSLFELNAEAFLGQMPWLMMNDRASMQTLDLIGELKDDSRASKRTRLYH